MLRGRDDVRVLITGIGARNAQNAVSRAIATEHPARVFTCGFAGALNPELRIADVVCARGNPIPNVRPVKFHCVERIVITCAEKSALWEATGADAVEMESEIIQLICSAMEIQCQTLRAISDTADEDLPLDFNALMPQIVELSSPEETFEFKKTDHGSELSRRYWGQHRIHVPQGPISPGRLAWVIMKSPQRIPALIRLGKNSALAAEKLAQTLLKVI
jgi:hypothetical protein